MKRRHDREVEERIAHLEERAERQSRRIANLERELVRLSPQVAALEARLEDVAEQVRPGVLVGDPGEHAEARALVDEVRREHARIRARISAAVVFEERMRVLEARLGIDGPTGLSATPSEPPLG